MEALRRVLRGETMIVAAERVEIERARPHGHVVATLGMVRQLGLDRFLPRRPERLAKLALALIVARVVEPAAKLSTARQLSGATASHSLGALLGLAEVDEDELYRSMTFQTQCQFLEKTEMADITTLTTPLPTSICAILPGNRCRFAGSACCCRWRAPEFYRPQRPVNDDGDLALTRRIDVR